MNHARYRVVAEQLDTINGPCEGEAISDALSRIAFAALPDWGAFEVPDWLVDGLRPLFARLMELSDSLKIDLLECLSHLYDSPVGPRPDLDLSELKAHLSTLPTGALPYALSIIARDGADAAPYLRRYVDHGNPDVRSEARAALERLQSVPPGQVCISSAAVSRSLASEGA